GRVEESLAVLAAAVRQFFARRVGKFTAVPTIWLLRVGMYPGSDPLLTITENFDLLLRAIRRFKQARELAEWFIGSQRDQSLWWLSESNQNEAALFEVLARQRLDRLGGVLDLDVDVESRCALGDDAGIARVLPHRIPKHDLLARDAKLA